MQDLNITIADTTTGQILRELTLEPTRDYQPNPSSNHHTPKTQQRTYKNVGPLSPMS